MKREDKQDTTIRCLLLTSVSTCFGHNYAHLQEIKGPVAAFGVFFWFCWMWLIAVVGALCCRMWSLWRFLFNSNSVQHIIVAACWSHLFILNLTDQQCSVMYQKVKQLIYHSCLPICGHPTPHQPTVRPKLSEESFSPQYVSNCSLSQSSLLAQRLMGASLDVCWRVMFQLISCFRLRTRCSEVILFVSRGLPVIVIQQYWISRIFNSKYH